jgi:hypothetical protein
MPARTFGGKSPKHRARTGSSGLKASFVSFDEPSKLEDCKKGDVAACRNADHRCAESRPKTYLLSGVVLAIFADLFIAACTARSFVTALHSWVGRIASLAMAVYR